ncbi:MAG: DUF3667 domain-containing protein [Gelidibacter sp.]
MSNKLTECSNCNQHFEAYYPYCPYCGQKAQDDLTLGVLFNNTISNYFSVDARFFRSFMPLMFKPGYLAKKFIEGKRLLYLHPAQFYLFVSVVFFFLFSFVSREQTAELNKELQKTLKSETAKVVVDSVAERKKDSLERVKLRKTLYDNQFLTGMKDKEIDSIVNVKDLTKKEVNFGFNEDKIDSLIRIDAPDTEIYKVMGLNPDAGVFKRKLYSQILKFYKSRDGGNVLKAFYDTIPIALFFLLPLFALILKLLYYKKGAYANHLVFSFYFFSYLFTVFSILVICDLIWENFPGWITLLVTLSTFFYLFLAVKRFYQQGWFLSFLKTSLTTFIFISLIIPSAAIIIGFFAFLYY